MRPRRLLLYYLMLILIMASWTNVVASPPMPVRILFLIAVLYPGLNDVRGLIVAALTCFWSIASTGYAYSYMPTMPYIYVVALSVALWMFWDRHKQITSKLLGGDNTLVFFFLIYVWLNDAYTESSMGYTAYTLLTMTMLVPFVPVVNKRTVTYFSMAFMTITIVLSYYLITTRDIFSFGSTGYTPELDRIGWTDQNYLGMVVGMGATVAITCLMHARLYRKIFLTYCIISIVLCVPVMLMLGSRGALMCLLASIILQLMFTKTKRKWKFLMVVAGIVFTIYLYTNDYFDLMEARLEADDGTGSNRFLIWDRKIKEFFTDNSFFDLIFGAGKDRGIGFGGRTGMENIGFHNDFLGFLICYGVVGLVFFEAMLFRPLFKCHRDTPYRVAIWGNLMYMFIGSMTLEPFLMDMFPLYAFLFYTLLLTKVKKEDA